VAATLHLAAAVVNFMTYECIHTANPLRERLATTTIGGPDQLVDGEIPVPAGPGLGIDLDLDFLKRYTIA
jgi:L-alanine-DL-glutamate epimerase-like enolase superfamily enzyme